MRTSADFVFFWGPDTNNGWASQWAPSPFTVAIPTSPPMSPSSSHEKLIRFPSAEHWMMYQKALLFNDTSVAHAVLAVPGTSKEDLKHVKQLGRQVSNFDKAIWTEHRCDIVLRGNLEKFRQNEGLRRLLEGTGDREFVEASPLDRIWGIGFTEKEGMGNMERWGMNLMGGALNESRRILREEDKQRTSA